MDKVRVGEVRGSRNDRQPYNRGMPRFCLVSFLSLLALALGSACSGGSSSGIPVSSRGVHLVVDAAGDSNTILTGRVAAVAFQEPGGRVEVHRPGPDDELVLASPLGGTSGMFLPDVERRPWESVHLRFVPGTLRARLPGGQVVSVETPSSGLSALFRSGERSLAPWIVLRHTGKVALRATAGGSWRWDPSMAVSNGDVHHLRQAIVRVLGVHVTDRRVTGELRRCASMPVTLHFSDSARLTRESNPDPLTPEEFLSGLSAGAEILIDGILIVGEEIEVIAAHHDDEPGGGRGQKTKVLGRILELVKQSETFRLQVEEVRVGGRDLPNTRPLVLTVRARDSKVKWVPRRGRHRGHLPFDALEKDMFVEVEYHGRATELTVKAHKINIRAERRHPFLHEVEGVLLELKVKERHFVLGPLDGGGFHLDGRHYTSLTVEVTEETVFVRRTRDAYYLVELESLRLGDRMWLLGTHSGNGHLVATLVRAVPGD